MQSAITVAQDLQDKIKLVLSNTALMVVDTPETAQTVSNILGAITAAEKEVKSFFKAPKDEAYAAHKAITAQEKSILAPLETAEKELRNKLGAYQYKMEMLRIEAEKEARRKAQEEAERKAQEAMRLEAAQKQAEQAGDMETAQQLQAQAEIAIAEADAIDTAASTITVAAPKNPDGISYRTDYVIESVDFEKLTPVVNGAPIVKLDESAVKNLIKATKGKIVIPGIKYREIQVPVVRR